MLINYTTADPLHTSPPSRAPLVLGVNYALLFVVMLFVGARLVVKGKLGKLGIEDVLIVISTIITITLVVITTVATKYGLGLHIEDIQPEWWPGYSKYSYASIVLGGTCYPFTKLSMLFFYLRLAPHRTFRMACFIFIGYIALSSTALTMINLFHCSPVRGGWDHSPDFHATCYEPSKFYYVYSSINVVTDILLMILPIPIIVRLQLRQKHQIGLALMFAAGISITAISAFGVHAMIVTYHSSDVTWDGVYSWMWAMAEFNTGIIIACMPSMMLFARWIRGPKPTDGTSGNSASKNGTIGSGGGGSSARPNRKYGHNKAAAEISTRISHSRGSEEYIMREMGGIVKSTELVVVETTPSQGSTRDDGSIC